MSANVDPLTALVQSAVRSGVEAALLEAGKPLRNRLMDTSVAAEYLGVGVDTVKRLHASGSLPSVRILEKKLMFDVRDLDAVIEERKEVR